MSRILKRDYLETARATEKFSSVIFIEFDICHRHLTIANGILLDFELHFQGKTLSCYAFLKNAEVLDIPSRFALTRIAPAVELLSLIFNL